jgi:protoporphyrinogen/coproporphyrinogen III oxidase
MHKRQIFILGGGISGLSLAYFLSHKSDLFELHLIEKSLNLGGWAGSDDSSGYFFEKGPRLFRTSTSFALLDLINALSMEEELIFAQRQPRYLLKNGKLKRIPSLSWDLVKAAFKEWQVKPYFEDESVFDFACRRFNAKVAHEIFDPMVRGIFGGKMQEISMKSGLPRLKALEMEYGSVIKGFLKAPRTTGSTLFSFRRGVQSFIRRLEASLSAKVHFSEEVLAIMPKPDGFSIKTTQNCYHADDLFSALPCHSIGKLLIPQLLAFPLKGTTLVQMGFSESVLKKRGFGYLTSSQGNEEVMGCIFDSEVFPEQNRHALETRLTFMLENETLKEEEARRIAHKALKTHLHIHKLPDVSHVFSAPKVFPQYRVGHEALIADLETMVAAKYPRLKLLGNYLKGPSLSDCIAKAKALAEEFLKKIL